MDPSTLRPWKVGLAAGLIAALLDALLIVATDDAASGALLVQVLLFWTFAGGFVVATVSPLGPFAHALTATIVLNLPWYLALAILPGKPELLPPLVAMSLVFGALFGVARRRVLSASPPPAPGAGGGSGPGR